MQRRSCFALNVEILEDRCVLSAPETAYQIVTPVMTAVIGDKAEAEVQQAMAQAQHQYENDLRKVQAESSALQSEAVTPLPFEGSKTTVVDTTPDKVTTTTSKPTNNTQDAVTTSTPAAHVQIQVQTSQTTSSTQEAQTSASTSVPQSVAPSAVNSSAVRSVANANSDTASVSSGLTAPPTAQQLARDANPAALATTGNPAASAELAANATMFGRDAAGNATQALGVAQPPAVQSLLERFSTSADGTGLAQRRSPLAGESRLTNYPEVLSTGVRPNDDSSLEAAMPTLLSADLMNGAAPQDAAALDAGVQQFLAQLDDLGREVTRSLQQSSVAVWVGLTLFGAVAFEIVRRRRARLALRGSGGADGPAESWVPGLSGPLGSEQP
jgi:hypothetical protein